ncbi:MAG: DUF3667 domain-containing protein, partial [Alphaproteobacteria bacterium]|nr:DUF3667 domain-containing protein [Alphaproteobacteria bacterium]
AQPGEFTRRYNSGQRASLLPPFRLFVIATLVFFLTLQATGLALVAFRSDRVAIAALPAQAADALKTQTGVVVADRKFETRVAVDFFVPAKAVGNNNLSAEEQREIADVGKSLKVEVDSATPDEAAGMRWVETTVKRAMLGYEHARADPVKLNGPLNIWLPRLMLVLVPIFALLLALMHWSPKVYLFEQLVFSIHIHTVIFVAMSVVAVGAAILGSADYLGFVWLLLAVYLLLAMRRVYGRSWWLTTLKGVALLFVYSIVLSIGLASIFLIALTEV